MKMIAVPYLRCSSRSSARICACVVTSSAVVGSSAISRRGLQRQRHRDHRALAQPAGQLAGIGIDALLGHRDADIAEQLDRQSRAPRRGVDR